MGFLDFLSGDKVSDKKLGDLITEDSGKPSNTPLSPSVVQQPSNQPKPVFGPSKITNDSLKTLADQGLIPNKDSAPKTWEGLTSGSLSLDDVQAKYKQVSQLSRNNPSSQSVQQIGDNATAKTDTPITQDSILQDYAKKGLIPSQDAAPQTWERIKSGELKIGDVQKNYQNVLSGSKIPTLETTKSVSDPLKTDPSPPLQNTIDPKTIQNFAAQQNQGAWQTVKNAVSSAADKIDTGIKDWSTKQDVLAAKQMTPEGRDELSKREDAIDQRLLSGLTFGGYKPSLPLPPDDTSAKAGAYIYNIMGNLASGVVGGEVVGGALRAIPAFRKVEQTASVIGNTIQDLKNSKSVAKAVGTVEEAASAGKALFTAQAKKYGLDFLKIGTESATLGAGVGAIKSTIQGNGWKNVLADSIHESGWFTAFGLAAQPVLGFLGNRIGARQTERTASSFKALAETPEVQALAKQGINPAFAEKLNTEAAPGFVGPRPQNEIMAKEALDKINKLNPELGLPIQLMTHPELLHENTQFSARQMSNQLFGEGGPLKFIADQNPNLKLLIDTGKHAEALDAAQSTMTNILSENRDIKDYALAPFANNASSLNKVMTNRIINSVNSPENYPNLQKNVFNYLNEPTAENAQLLQGKNAPRKFFEKVSDASKKFTDVRLNPQEIDTIVGDSFKDMLGAISGDKNSLLPQGLFGKIKDSSDILKTALTFNKELNRRYIQSYAQNPYDMQSYFLKANPEIAPGIEAQVNLTRINKEMQTAMDTRRELSQAMGELQTKINGASSPEAKADLNFQMTTTKDKIQSLNQVLTSHNSDLTTIKNSLSGYKPEQMQEIQNFVNKVYVPQRGGNTFQNELDARMSFNVQKKAAARAAGQAEPEDAKFGDLGNDIVQSQVEMENKYYPKIENSSKWNARFGAKENPYYLAADSELADIMHGFLVSGRDISKNRGKMIGGLFGVNIDNPRRAMQRELGPNNVLEKFFNMATDAQAIVERQAKTYMDNISDIGIKQGSVESAWVQKLGEKRALPTDSEFLALRPDQQEKIQSAIPQLRQHYNDLIDTINLKMKQLNLPQINKRDDFFTHMGAVTDGLPKLMEKMVAGDLPEEAISYLPGKNGQGRQGYWDNSNSNFDPDRTVFRSEKKRGGGEFIDDAIGGLQYYLKPALERIHYADLIRQIDVAKQFAPENMGQFLQDFKTKYLLKFESETDKGAADWWKQGSQFLSKNIQKGAILGNVDILLKHIQSIGNAFSFGAHGAKALGQLFSDEGDQIVSLSKNLQLRGAVHIDVDRTADLLKEFGGSGFVQQGFEGKVGEKVRSGVKDAGDFVSQFLEHATDMIFKTAAKHSFLTGYSRAQQAGLNPEAAAQFADKFTELTQGLHTSVGRPEFYQVKSAKLLTNFSSFSTNLAATLLNDLPTIARTEGAPQAVGMLMKSVAGLMIANEVSRKAGMPSAINLLETIPFLNNYRFGIGGALGSVYNAAQVVYGAGTDNAQMTRTATSKLVRAGISMTGIPGAAQTAKTYDTYERKTGNSVLDIPGVKQVGGFLGLKKQGKTFEYVGKNKDQYSKDLVFGHQNPDELNPPINRNSFDYKTKKSIRNFINSKL